MNKFFKIMLPLWLAGAVCSVHAESRKTLQLVEVFDAGQPQAVILKLYDQSADVICYVLTPERAAHKQVEGKLLYDGNQVGAISCVKNRQQVIATPQP